MNLRRLIDEVEKAALDEALTGREAVRRRRRGYWERWAAGMSDGGRGARWKRLLRRKTRG